MTLEKQCSEIISVSSALDFDALNWEKLSDDEVLAIFSASLNVTRPEYVSRSSGMKSSVPYISPEKKVMFDKIKSSGGLDLAAMMRDLGIKGNKK